MRTRKQGGNSTHQFLLLFPFFPEAIQLSLLLSNPLHQLSLLPLDLLILSSVILPILFLLVLVLPSKVTGLATRGRSSHVELLQALFPSLVLLQLPLLEIGQLLFLL